MQEKADHSTCTAFGVRASLDSGRCLRLNKCSIWTRSMRRTILQAKRVYNHVLNYVTQILVGFAPAICMDTPWPRRWLTTRLSMLRGPRTCDLTLDSLTMDCLRHGLIWQTMVSDTKSPWIFVCMGKTAMLSGYAHNALGKPRYALCTDCQGGNQGLSYQTGVERLHHMLLA